MRRLFDGIEGQQSSEERIASDVENAVRRQCERARLAKRGLQRWHLPAQAADHGIHSAPEYETDEAVSADLSRVVGSQMVDCVPAIVGHVEPTVECLRKPAWMQELKILGLDLAVRVKVRVSVRRRRNGHDLPIGICEIDSGYRG